MVLEKGGFGWIALSMTTAVIILLVVVIGPLTSRMDVSGDLSGEIRESSTQYKAHAAMVSIRSNEKLMKYIRHYALEGEGPLEMPESVDDLEKPSEAYIEKLEENDNPNLGSEDEKTWTFDREEETKYCTEKRFTENKDLEDDERVAGFEKGSHCAEPAIRSRVKEALSMFGAYSFQIQTVEDGSFEDVFKVSSDRPHRSSKTFIASPSEENPRIVVGVKAR